ncbi:MAG: alpha/beta hydrolase [Clostridiales bacterium]|nr:alpha/beta hydrolase [Clostridiales bacterium]
MNNPKVKELLEARNLPQLLQFQDGSPVASAEDWNQRREEILSILSHEVYGERIPDPLSLVVEVNESNDNSYAAKVLEEHLTLTAGLKQGSFSFPFHFFKPKNVVNPMTIVYVAFRSDLPDRYLPIEEITDEGIAVAIFNYDDVVPDKEDDFTKGLAKLLYTDGKRESTDPGKIMMWAWAASRVMDYLKTRDDIDHDNIGVMGHSRLGKTALVAAAYDQRFTFCFPNNSGCSGDAITRDKEGERVEPITRVFPYWFCLNYSKYANKEEEMPFDQHFLIGAIAPRFVSGGAAVEDTWADPNSQFLGYAAASEAYKLLGLKGLVHSDRLPEIGDTFHEGSLGYHLRSGSHFHSRYDWLRYIEFMKKHRR